MSWSEMMQQHFPMAGADGRFELSFVEQHPSDDGALIGVLRTIVWDVFEGERSLRDIKEQRVRCGRTEHLELADRYEAFLRATAMVISQCAVDKLESAMPIDLIVEDALDLLSARDEDDFVKALRAKSRLGEFLA